MSPLWTERRLVSLDLLMKEVQDENDRQISKWGVQTHSPAEWALILAEEWGELGRELCKAHFDGALPANLREEAIQVATLALKIAEMGAAP